MVRIFKFIVNVGILRIWWGVSYYFLYNYFNELCILYMLKSDRVRIGICGLKGRYIKIYKFEY